MSTPFRSHPAIHALTHFPAPIPQRGFTARATRGSRSIFGAQIGLSLNPLEFRIKPLKFLIRAHKDSVEKPVVIRRQATFTPFSLDMDQPPKK
jgi:hypothetical protein